MLIPLCVPNIKEEEIKAVERVLNSGWLAHGDKNKEFEEMFADYIGVKHAISMNSCTSALQLAIEALEITGEIIVPSFTFVASANSIINAGAEPVFVDINYDTCNIDYNKIEDHITEDTEAIMVVHYGGQCCAMDRINNIAEKYNLSVIEDSAETIGGEYKGKKAGSFGIGCFSFFPTKNMTTGEGGMLTTNNDDIAEKVKTLLGHGISSTTYSREEKKKPWFRSAKLAGYNYRMSNVLAAIGVEQLMKLEDMNSKRRKNAFYLNKKLSKISSIEIPVEKDNRKHVYQMYTIKVKEPIKRDEFVMKLRDKGIGASVHFYPPIHLQYRYKNMYDLKTSLSVTEEVSEKIVTLPMYPQLKESQLDKIVTIIKSTIEELYSPITDL